MIRTAAWKLIVYGNGPGELYDLKNDPGELSNLVGDRDHQKTVENLQNQLHQ